ncbi:MAG: phosphotransferase family protein [Saccharothrix sp.]|nr:phosphotransferase family protein [Saccharothrix sp.]
MPVPQQRDPEVTRARLGRWLSARVAGGEPVSIGAIRVPDARGFANETLVFDASWRGPDGSRARRLVARIASPRYQVYPDARLAEQHRLMESLGRHTDVPVPPVHGHEPDPGLLGGPFLVMGHVPGRVPPDFPSYHRQGWVAGLPARDREVLWWRGLDALRRVHRVDHRELGLAARQVEHYADHLDFFRSADTPVVLRALEWLAGNRPPAAPDVLLWGDARLGNLVFDGLDVAAVLDWEMAALGPAEVDLAWYLYLDRYLSEGIGSARLDGLPDRDRTVRRYAALLGREPRDLPYHEVFAAFRFALITARVADLVVAHGIVPAGTDFPLHRNACALLERTLEAAATT